jgi:serine/threonine protein phosphatase PrpC
MSKLETVTATQSYRDRCEDRVAVISHDDRTVIMVADGAGGVGFGDLAAETIVREIKSAYSAIHSADQWAELLRQIDHRIAMGESTAVVVDVRPYGIAGASVGDSCAWIVHHDQVHDLTRNQARKPLLGTGHASPVAFVHGPLHGILLVATDGFFDYAKREAITPMIAQSDFYTIPKQCIEMVRLPSGDMWDDVGIVAARNRPPYRSRKRYSI